MRELIDRQETLDAIDERFESLLRRFDYDSYENADEKTKLVCDGLSEAEDVVMGLPSALGTNLAEVGTDLISRQALLDKFEPWLKVKDYNDGELNMLKAILYEIRFMRSAQPEIIRCTECKHYREYDSKYVENAVVVQCMADRYPISETIPDGWFCAGAERKDDE